VILRLLTAALLACGLAAQSPPPPVFSDAQIEARLQERLAKSVIGKDGFSVRVRGSVVYWDGKTSVAQHKGAATRMAKSAGARRVVNNIQVIGGKAPGKPKPSPASVAKPVAPVKSPVSLPDPTVKTPRAVVRWVPAGH
jgi:hypothetical protein